MSLLRDIQNAAVSKDTDVATLLRKCKILAVRLGNDEFKNWVDSELNGYESIDNLPEYRILHTISHGHFSGPYGSSLKDAPIPPSCLPEEFRDNITTSYLKLPISGYVSLVNNKEGKDAIEQWPADIIAHFGRKIYNDMNCLSAWKIIPLNALDALIDTIKTRILNFVLEIEREAPKAGEASPNQPPLPQERVNHVFYTYISGDVQNLATGSTNFSQSKNNKVIVNDVESLKKYLLSKGLDKKDIEEMQQAIEQDRQDNAKGFGERVQAWMAKMVGKAASGVWNVTVSVAGSLIGKALSDYFGLK